MGVKISSRPRKMTAGAVEKKVPRRAWERNHSGEASIGLGTVPATLFCTKFKNCKRKVL